MNKIKRNDRVIVITGKDKGKTGSVTRLLGDGRGLRVRSKYGTASHQGQPANESTWRNYRKRSSYPVSNISIYNSTTNKADKVRFELLESGKKYEYTNPPARR